MWSYRAMKGRDGGFRMIEAYYDDNGKIWGWVDDTYPAGDTLAELKKDLKNMLKDTEAPVVKERDLPEEGAEPPDYEDD